MKLKPGLSTIHCIRQESGMGRFYVSWGLNGAFYSTSWIFGTDFWPASNQLNLQVKSRHHQVLQNQVLTSSMRPARTHTNMYCNSRMSSATSRSSSCRPCLTGASGSSWSTIVRAGAVWVPTAFCCCRKCRVFSLIRHTQAVDVEVYHHRQWK